MTERSWTTAGIALVFFAMAVSSPLQVFGTDDARWENSSSGEAMASGDWRREDPSAPPSFWSGPGRSGSRTALTLEEALDLGFKASKALHAAEAGVAAAAARAKEVDAARMPSFKFGAGYARLSEVPPFEVTLPFSPNPQLPGPTTFVVSPSYFDNYSLRFSVQQPLFTGFRLQAGSDLAKFAARAAEEELVKDKSEVAFSVRTAYWNLYKAREFKNAVDENVAQVKAHLTDVQNLFEQGLLTKNEVLRVEVQLSQVELARLDAGSAAEMAQVWLNSLTGLPLDTDVVLETRIAEGIKPRETGGLSSPRIEAGEAQNQKRPDSDAADRPGNHSAQTESQALRGAGVENLTAEALNRRPELRALDFRVKAAGAGVRAAKSGWYPQVFLTGNYYDMRPNPRLLPAKDKFYSTWDLGISVSMDLWNWGQTKRQTQQAEAQLTQARDALGQVKDAVSVEVRQAWLALSQAEEKIAVARKAAAQAEENLRVTQERFREGVALNTDVLDAEVGLLQARTSLAQSLVDRELADARLRKAVGE